MSDAHTDAYKYRCSRCNRLHDVEDQCPSELAAPACSPAIPRILFDGWAVYQAMGEVEKRRTSAENVADVLDAVVRILRQENNY